VGSSGYDGGGIYMNRSSPTITECIISNNSATHGNSGGGIFMVDSSPTITECIISNNSANVSGGGDFYGFFFPNYH